MKSTGKSAAREPQTERSGKGRKGAESKPRPPNSAAIRETIESVAIAFILAFLFRTFEAEAFVIPTGSMAPTLMGRHKDLICEACGYEYQASASDEVDKEGNSRNIEIATATCPMCRHTMIVGPSQETHNKYPSYTGDRILVGKFAYRFNDPERWDVAVFHFPGDAQQNYIKRLTGLPGETIKITHGDIYVDRPGTHKFEIARKPPHKLLAMLQAVFDNDYMPAIAKYGFPARWQLDGAAGAVGAWAASADGTSFETSGEGPGQTWLRYQHLVPTYRQWRFVEEHNSLAANDRVMPRLITDFTAYNSSTDRPPPPPEFASDWDDDDHYWVGDLALMCTVESLSDSGMLTLELNKGGRQFQCHIDVGSGKARLSISGSEAYGPEAMTKLRGRGRHRLIFSNCDHQLRLWVDGSVVRFGDGDEATDYGELGNERPRQNDLRPASIVSAGAKVRLSHLKLYRDIYYIANRSLPDSSVATQSYKETPLPLQTVLHPGSAQEYSQEEPFVQFSLGRDQFFAMGDNSSRSQDSRLWGGGPAHTPFYVRRDLLIGKAFFIYWPHSWDRPIPFFPNFARMGFIR